MATKSHLGRLVWKFLTERLADDGFQSAALQLGAAVAQDLPVELLGLLPQVRREANVPYVRWVVRLKRDAAPAARDRTLRTAWLGDVAEAVEQRVVNVRIEVSLTVLWRSNLLNDGLDFVLSNAAGSTRGRLSADIRKTRGRRR